MMKGVNFGAALILVRSEKYGWRGVALEEKGEEVEVEEAVEVRGREREREGGRSKEPD